MSNVNKTREYKFYGVSVNQQEVQISRKMTYHYDEIKQSIQSIYGAKSATGRT